MRNWDLVGLGELARPKQWPTLSKAEMQLSGFPVYGANGRIGFTSEYTHEKPTILIGCRGSCGSVHVTEPRSYANGNAMAMDGLDESRVDVGFLVHFLRYRGFRDVTTGTSQPQIIRQNLVRVQVPLPLLSAQRQIAEVLDRAEALRAKRRDAVAQLEALSEAVFLDLFGDPRRKPEKWPLELLVRLCRPKQWPTITTADLTSEGYPVFGANGLIGRFSEFNHDTPTVLVTCRGATCGTINVSPPRCYVTGNAMALDDPDPSKLTVQYLEHVLRKRGLQDTISGSAQPQITRQGLQGVKLPVPPLALQRTFATRVAAIERLKAAHRASLAKLDELFTSLQHRAFRGEL